MSIGFSLLSPGFWALSIAAILLLTTLSGPLRHAAFLTVNLLFLAALLLGPSAALATIGFCVFGYVIVHFVCRWPDWGFRLGLIAFLLLFVWMRNYEILEWILPQNNMAYSLSTVGLSFLLFRIIHVMIEARSRILESIEFLPFINYSLNFTTFMMGPIQRYRDFLEQWNGERDDLAMDFESHLNAVLRILTGLVKAYVVGALIVPFANISAAELANATFLKGMIHVYSFYIYLYLNFSGYCDVVIGVGSLMGIRPPENFDKPFIARNVSDFWLRMHRSLTTWLTDYVFSPCYKWTLTSRLFAKKSQMALYLSLMTTMLVCGLWHGTTLSFFIFGLIHGAYLVIYRSWDMLLTRRLGREGVKAWRKHPLAQVGGMFITFNAVSFAFIFFRLEAHDAFIAISGILGL